MLQAVVAYLTCKLTEEETQLLRAVRAQCKRLKDAEWYQPSSRMTIIPCKPWWMPPYVVLVHHVQELRLAPSIPTQCQRGVPQGSYQCGARTRRRGETGSVLRWEICHRHVREVAAAPARTMASVVLAFCVLQPQ